MVTPEICSQFKKILYQTNKQITKFLLVMQIAITFISENVLDCIVHEDSIIQVMTIGILAT